MRRNLAGQLILRAITILMAPLFAGGCSSTSPITPARIEKAIAVTFANLVENAARYGAGKPVSVRARNVGSRLLVRIVDQGVGIAPEEQVRIFTPFYRVDHEHHGSGLGLAIAKGFVEANGGKISVESLPGQGTSFVVELPVEPTATEPSPTQTQGSPCWLSSPRASEGAPMSFRNALLTSRVRRSSPTSACSVASPIASATHPKTKRWCGRCSAMRSS